MLGRIGMRIRIKVFALLIGAAVGLWGSFFSVPTALAQSIIKVNSEQDDTNSSGSLLGSAAMNRLRPPLILSLSYQRSLIIAKP